jgi:hypothetical protein
VFDLRKFGNWFSVVYIGVSAGRLRAPAPNDERGSAGGMKCNGLDANDNIKGCFVLRFILVGRPSQACHNLRARCVALDACARVAHLVQL